MSGNGATSATGGSTSSQAHSLDRHVWKPRPWVSFSLRVAIMLIPLLAGVLAVKVVARSISRPSDPLLFAVWLAAPIIVSFVAATATQRATRRLAPLGGLVQDDPRVRRRGTVAVPYRSAGRLHPLTGPPTLKSRGVFAFEVCWFGWGRCGFGSDHGCQHGDGSTSSVEAVRWTAPVVHDAPPFESSDGVLNGHAQR